MELMIRGILLIVMYIIDYNSIMYIPVIGYAIAWTLFIIAAYNDVLQQFIIRCELRQQLENGKGFNNDEF